MSFEVRTAASFFGGASRVSCVHFSTCQRFLLRGLASGHILITELCPPSNIQAIHKELSSQDSSVGSVAGHATHSSSFYKHFLVSTSHNAPITHIHSNTHGMIAIGSDDQSVSVTSIAWLLGSNGFENNSNNNIDSSSWLSQLTHSVSSQSSHHLQASDYVHKFHDHTLPVTSVFISNDGKLYSSSKDHSIVISDVNSQSRIASISLPSSVQCFILSPDESEMYVGGQDGNIYKIDFQQFESNSSHSSSHSVHYDWKSNAETHFKSLSSMESTDMAAMNEWNLNEQNNKSTAAGSSLMNISSSVSPNNQGDVIPNIFRGHSQAVSKLSMSLDGSRLVSSSLDGFIIVWDKNTCQILHRVQPFKSGLVHCQVSLRPNENLTGKKKHETSAASHQTTSINQSFINPSSNKSSKHLKPSIPFTLIHPPSSQYTSYHLGSSSNSLKQSDSKFNVDSNNSASHLLPTYSEDYSSSPLANPWQSSSLLPFASHASYSIDTSTDQSHEFGLFIASRLQESHSSQVDNLIAENERLKALNEEWKKLNNSLFSSSVSSALNQ